MTQIERDKRAIRTVLQQTGGTTRQEIAQRAGDGLSEAMIAMIESGEVITRDEFPQGHPGHPGYTVYQLAPPKPINRQDIVEHMTGAGVDEKMARMVADFVMAPMSPLEIEARDLPGIESIRRVEEIFTKAATRRAETIFGKRVKSQDAIEGKEQ